jgi:hypothetical protein
VDEAGLELCNQWQDIVVLVLQLNDLQPQSFPSFLTGHPNTSMRREKKFSYLTLFILLIISTKCTDMVILAEGVTFT